MLEGLDKETETRLSQWLNESIKTGNNQLGEGYQGSLYLYRDSEPHLIIKVAKGNFITRRVHEFMLHKERNVYRKMQGLKGIPNCYGMLDNKYLVLEYISGIPIRHAEIADRTAFFDELLKIVRNLHELGVAHGDMKKQDNLLVIDKQIPCLIDFGVAVIRKNGISPINHFFYKTAQKFDFNAWIKLKYQGRYDEISEADKPLWNRTKTEIIARWIKFKFLALKRFFSKS